MVETRLELVELIYSGDETRFMAPSCTLYYMLGFLFNLEAIVDSRQSTISHDVTDEKSFPRLSENSFSMLHPHRERLEVLSSD